MKNTSQLILLVLFVFTMSLCSCQKEHKRRMVVLSVDVAGTLTGGSVVSYRNEYGVIQVDSLHGDWSKAFETDHGAHLFLEAMGELRGTMTLKIEAFTCNRSSYESSGGSISGNSSVEKIRIALSE